MSWWVGASIRKGKKDKVIEKSFAMVKRILTLQLCFHDLFGQLLEIQRIKSE
jgi:hypothetical protein